MLALGESLGTTIGDIVPLAIAVAISPFPVIAIILVLGTPRARLNGPLFALGWLIGLILVNLMVVLLLGGGDETDDTPARWADALRVALGLTLFLLAIKQWPKRPRPGKDVEMPGWMGSLDRTTPPKAVVLGLMLATANPKNLVLTGAAATTIAQAGLERGDAMTAVAVFVVIGSTVVVGAVLFSLVARVRAERVLASMKTFMLTNSAIIMMVVFLVLGAKVLAEGIAGLTA